MTTTNVDNEFKLEEAKDTPVAHSSTGLNAKVQFPGECCALSSSHLACVLWMHVLVDYDLAAVEGHLFFGVLTGRVACLPPQLAMFVNALCRSFADCPTFFP